LQHSKIIFETVDLPIRKFNIMSVMLSPAAKYLFNELFDIIFLHKYYIKTNLNVAAKISPTDRISGLE